MKRVVITGMGIYDPVRAEFGYRSALTGFVEDPDLKSFLSRRQRISLGEESRYAYMATIEAMQNANLDDDFFSQNEAGIIYGNDSTALSVIESIDTIREKRIPPW